jgi:hypothetical protein
MIEGDVLPQLLGTHMIFSRVPVGSNQQLLFNISVADDPPEVPTGEDVLGADRVIDGDLLRILIVELKLMCETRTARAVTHVYTVAGVLAGRDTRMVDINRDVHLAHTNY